MTSLSSRQIERPALAPSSRLQGLRDGKLPRRLAIAALILLLAFLSLYPLSMLLYGSLHSTPPGIAGSFDLDGYLQVLTWQSAVLFANTVGISLPRPSSRWRWRFCWPGLSRGPTRRYAARWKR